MFKKIKHVLKKNKYVKVITFLKNTRLSKINPLVKKYPEVIQLPLTYKCNSKCIMCNIWNMDSNNEWDIYEFTRMIQDPIFKKVKVVGFNGGEPALLSNLDQFVFAAIKYLPLLKSINIISNGFNTNRLLTYLEKIYTVCKQKNIYFSVSISLDGYGEIHDKIRGIPNVFGKTIATIREINKNRKKYCDSFDVGCTITQQNANHLVELDVFAKKENIDIKYRIGIENKRIESYPISKQFSIFHQKTEFSVREYIFSMYMRTKNLNDRFKYFSIFQSICNKRTKRLAGCVWKDRAITIDARGEVFYCAVESNSIGSLREKKGEEIFFDKKNLLYRKAIVDQKCMSCVHDYIGPIEFKDAMSFLKELVFNRYYLYVYYVKGLFT